MKTYIVSGSSSGIGRAICENLLAQGERVFGLARDHSKFNPDNDNYHPISIDFSRINTLESELKALTKKVEVVDGMILCAGMGRFAEVEQFSLAQIQEIMQVNFLSQVMLVKTFLPGMKQRASGKIIFMGSESALSGARKGSIYCASKFALRGFSQSLRQECKQQNIAVTIINPGLVRTPFFEKLQFQPGAEKENAITAEQVAATVALAIDMDPQCILEEINLQPLKASVLPSS